MTKYTARICNLNQERLFGPFKMSKEVLTEGMLGERRVPVRLNYQGKPIGHTIDMRVENGDLLADVEIDDTFEHLTDIINLYLLPSVSISIQNNDYDASIVKKMVLNEVGLVSYTNFETAEKIQKIETENSQ